MGLTSPVLWQGLPASQFLGSPQCCTRVSPEAGALKVSREPPTRIKWGLEGDELSNPQTPRAVHYLNAS